MSTNTVDIQMINAAGDSIPSRFLLSAIADELNRRPNWVKNGPQFSVQLIVNGESLNYSHIIERWWKSCNDDIEKRARKIAVQMVTEAGLDPISDALRDAEQKIREALKIWDEDTYR